MASRALEEAAGLSGNQRDLSQVNSKVLSTTSSIGLILLQEARQRLPAIPMRLKLAPGGFDSTPRWPRGESRGLEWPLERLRRLRDVSPIWLDNAFRRFRCGSSWLPAASPRPQRLWVQPSRGSRGSRGPSGSNLSFLEFSRVFSSLETSWGISQRLREARGGLPAASSWLKRASRWLRVASRALRSGLEASEAA